MRRWQKTSSRAILIDAGHGMSNRRPEVVDPGTVSKSGIREADLTFAYAKALGESMRLHSWKTFLTRTEIDTPMPLNRRRQHAMELQPTCLVSIHFNSDASAGDTPADKKQKGTEVWYRTQSSLKLAESITESLIRFPLRNPAVKRSGSISILRYSPSVLIEVGFVDDPEDLINITNTQWLLDFVSKVRDGISKWEESSK